MNEYKDDMCENTIAKTLRIIGIVEVICGVILFFYFLGAGDGSGWIGFAIMIGSFISCMLFVGFAEMINLLQHNADRQDEIVAILKQNPNEDKSSKSKLQDIEANLPKM